jgi:Flp pilus assembly protein TadD
VITVHSLLAEGLRQHNLRNYERAESLYRQVLAIDPTNTDAMHLIGVLALHVNRPDLGLDFLKRAIAIKADVATYHSNLGLTLQALGDHDGALEAFDAALALQPDLAEVHNNKGAALEDMGRRDEALKSYGRSCALRDDAAEPYNNMGTLYAERGDIDKAMGCFRRAMELDPTFGEPFMNLGMCLMLKGKFEEGARHYERRWHTRKLPLRPRAFEQPQWIGQNIAGKTLLIHAEQGMGDTFQFIRFAPLLARRGVRVVAEMQVEVIDVIRRMPSIAEAVVTGESLPKFDWHCPTMSLPLAFGVNLGNIPANLPYLDADPDLADLWGERLGPADGMFTVGLVWAGRPTHKNDHNRSMTLEILGPLADIPDIRFVSLQKGAPSQQAETPPPGMLLFEATDLIKSFDDTAALLSHVDLLITVDTSVAHLAGAMGKPVWVFIPDPPEWRWLEKRSDTPWYPSMRLFRRTGDEPWSNVVNQMVVALRDRIEALSRNRRSTPRSKAPPAKESTATRSPPTRSPKARRASSRPNP